MNILESLTSGRVTISCEVFPPKLGQPLDGALKIVAQTVQLKPAFISVTCGSGGATANNTVEIADAVQNTGDVMSLAHLVCVGATREKVHELLTALRFRKIDNVLALRGDWPGGVPQTSGDFAHASDLAAEIAAFGGFTIGGACYPEGHPESHSLIDDTEGLKRKVESGCSFLTTQMFFDNNVLYNFMFRLLRAHIDVPVAAGIMPVTNARQISRICALSGTALPPRFRAIIDRFQDDDAAMKQAGIAYATDQIIDLIANGVNNIHIYTMNKPDIAGSIMRNLSDIIR